MFIDKGFICFVIANIAQLETVKRYIVIGFQRGFISIYLAYRAAAFFVRPAFSKFFDNLFCDRAHILSVKKYTVFASLVHDNFIKPSLGDKLIKSKTLVNNGDNSFVKQKRTNNLALDPIALVFATSERILYKIFVFGFFICGKQKYQIFAVDIIFYNLTAKIAKMEFFIIKKAENRIFLKLVLQIFCKLLSAVSTIAYKNFIFCHSLLIIFVIIKLGEHFVISSDLVKLTNKIFANK